MNKKMKPPIITSSRFVLRPFAGSDKKPLVKNLNNKKITKNLLSVPFPYTMSDAQEWINKNLKEYKKEKSKMICFAIDIDGEAVGGIGRHKIEAYHTGEVGYWLAEQYWSRGIMTEAVRLITKFGFGKLNLKRMYAYTFPFNKESQKVVVKNGYKFEGVLKKHSYKNGKYIDDYLYAKIK